MPTSSISFSAFGSSCSVIGSTLDWSEKTEWRLTEGLVRLAERLFPNVAHRDRRFLQRQVGRTRRRRQRKRSWRAHGLHHSWKKKPLYGGSAVRVCRNALERMRLYTSVSGSPRLARIVVRLVGSVSVGGGSVSCRQD